MEGERKGMGQGLHYHNSPFDARVGGLNFLKGCARCRLLLNRAFINGLIKGSIKGMVSPGDRPRPSKLFYFFISDSLWVYVALGNILSSIVSNSHFGKRPVASDMMIFGLHFLLQITESVNYY